MSIAGISFFVENGLKTFSERRLFHRFSTTRAKAEQGFIDGPFKPFFKEKERRGSWEPRLWESEDYLSRYAPEKSIDPRTERPHPLT